MAEDQTVAKAETQRILDATFVGLGKADSSAAIRSNVKEYEDEFQGWYGIQVDGTVVMEPPYNFCQLETLVQECGALQPCINAMVTNIVGTGFDFQIDDPQKQEQYEQAVDNLWGFFSEPWIGQSWLSLTKNVWRDYESIGNGYIEVIRDPKTHEIVFCRYVPGKTVRMVRLDKAVPVKQTFSRNGRDIEITVDVRERRYAQCVASQLVYFKEYGASRDCSKTTGKWAAPGEIIPEEDQATELLHFRCVPDTYTPYGVPRWIAATPSLLGSRRAEEYNLSFFEAGGIPPVMITVAGGTLAAVAREALEKEFGSKNPKHRAFIMEVNATGGDLNSPNNVRIGVEQFGGARQSDSLFENYQEQSEVRIRKAFRLPPLFVGLQGAESFATAYTAYVLAESQVFKPEREEFEEIINLTLMKELTDAPILYRSLALKVKDVQQQLAALQIAIDSNHVDPEEQVKQVNEIADLDIQTVPEEVVKQPTQVIVPAANNENQSGGEEKPGASNADQTGTELKQKSDIFVRAMAEEIRLGIEGDLSAEQFQNLIKNLGTCTPDQQVIIRGLVAYEAFRNIHLDPEGLSNLGGCTMAIMARDSVSA